MKAYIYFFLVVSLFSCKNQKQSNEPPSFAQEGLSSDAGGVFLDSLDSQINQSFKKTAEKTDHVYLGYDVVNDDSSKKTAVISLYNPYKRTIKSVLLLSYNKKLRPLKETTIEVVIRPGEKVKASSDFIDQEHHVFSTVLVRFTDNTTKEVNPKAFFDRELLQK